MLVEVFEEVVATHCASLEWPLALDVATAISGATGATLFVRVERSSALRMVVSTLPDEHAPRAARTAEDSEADLPQGRGASFVATCCRTTADSAWWRVPIRDGAALIGVLYLEYLSGREPSDRALRSLTDWARAAALLLQCTKPPGRLTGARSSR